MASDLREYADLYDDVANDPYDAPTLLRAAADQLELLEQVIDQQDMSWHRLADEYRLKLADALDALATRQKDEAWLLNVPAVIGDYQEVTRVEVIDSTGRVFTARYPPGVVVQVQDDGRTLKVFAGKPQTPAKRSRVGKDRDGR
jgi:hypothetical protein